MAAFANEVLAAGLIVQSTCLLSSLGVWKRDTLLFRSLRRMAIPKEAGAYFTEIEATTDLPGKSVVYDKLVVSVDINLEPSRL